MRPPSTACQGYNSGIWRTSCEAALVLPILEFQPCTSLLVSQFAGGTSRWQGHQDGLPHLCWRLRWRSQSCPAELVRLSRLSLRSRLASATAGGNQFLLTVSGNNFRRNSLVSWNGSFRATMFASSHELVATITAMDIAQCGTVLVSVLNPPEGGPSFVSGGIRRDVHHVVQRQDLKRRFLHGQAVTAWGLQSRFITSVTFSSDP